MFTDTDIFMNAFESLPDQQRKRLCELGKKAFQDKYHGSARGYGVNITGIYQKNDGSYHGFQANIFDATKDHLVPEYFEVLDGETTYLIPINKTTARDEIVQGLNLTPIQEEEEKNEESIDELLEQQAFNAAKQRMIFTRKMSHPVNKKIAELEKEGQADEKDKMLSSPKRRDSKEKLVSN